MKQRQGERCVRVRHGLPIGVRRWLLSFIVLQLPCAAFAEVTYDASAIARYEYNTNVYDLQSGFAVPGTSDYERSDTLYTYGAALDVNYLWSEQKLFANLSTSDFRYDHFTQLDHNEYNVDAGWKWKLGRIVDGTLEVLRDRIMVPFTSVENAQFVLQTEQRETALVGIEVSPDWRVEGSGRHSAIEQVLFGTPNIDLTESFGQLALKYIGVAGLTAGVSGGYTSGNFTGASAATQPAYQQTAGAVVVSYQPSGRSILNGALGYSDRTSESDLDSISGFTGKVDYTNQLTGKTSVQVQLSRIINSYIANLSSEIDDVAAMNVHWQATYRIGVAVGYSFTNRNLPGQGNAPVGGDRVDHLQYASLNIDYEAQRWLSIKPYVNLQTRSSNFIGGNFNATVYGLYFTVQWQNHPQEVNFYRPAVQP